MLPFAEIKAALLALTKVCSFALYNVINVFQECQSLWDQNKDMQGSFINDLAELQRFQCKFVSMVTRYGE
jgi:hypothetical protein